MQNCLLAALPRRTQSRYAEIRPLVGGVTAIQGASGKYPSKDEALVRNVDLRIFGQHKARHPRLPSASSRDLPRLLTILRQIAAGEVTALVPPPRRGTADDQRSAGEFAHLVEELLRLERPVRHRRPHAKVETGTDRYNAP